MEEAQKIWEIEKYLKELSDEGLLAISRAYCKEVERRITENV